MQGKNPLYSKTVWFNVVMTIIGIAALSDQFIPAQYAMVSTFIQGVGNLVLRIWFTSVPLTPIIPQNEEEMAKYSEEEE